MKPKDFALLVAACLIAAFNNLLSKIVVDPWGIPPYFYAALRFALVGLVTLPWLLPMPRPAWRIIAIALLMGGGNFGLLFMGLRTTTASAAAIISQLAVPFTMILSILFLQEKIHWRRGLGISLTLAGVLLVTWRPGGFAWSAGFWLIAAAALAGSAGAILMKQVEDVGPLRFQAWVGLISSLALATMSALFETGQWQAASAAGLSFVATILFTALAVSVGAHSIYYYLIRRYEANLLAPLTLITPLATIALGVLISGDPFDQRMTVGSAIALLGVLVVAMRRKPATALIVEREAH